MTDEIKNLIQIIESDLKLAEILLEGQSDEIRQEIRQYYINQYNDMLKEYIVDRGCELLSNLVFQIGSFSYMIKNFLEDNVTIDIFRNHLLDHLNYELGEYEWLNKDHSLLRQLYIACGGEYDYINKNKVPLIFLREENNQIILYFADYYIGDEDSLLSFIECDRGGPMPKECYPYKSFEWIFDCN